MELVSQQGKKLVAVGGFTYRFDKMMMSGKESWRCNHRGCRGRIYIVGGEPGEGVNHNHVPNPAEGLLRKCMQRIKDRAATSSESSGILIQEELAALPAEAAVLLPNFHSSQRLVQRKRKLAQQSIPDPFRTRDINLSDHLSNTLGGVNFLLHDSGAEDPERIFIFGTAENLNLLAENDCWFTDGTFKEAPHLVYQVVTIHAKMGDLVPPLLYILLPKRSEAMYIRALRVISSLNPRLHPKSIMCDFEKGFHNALQAVFKDVAIEGCPFHFGQCIWRMMQQCALTELYNQDEAIRLQCKQIMALAFVPVVQIEETFEMLRDEASALLTPLLDCFEDTLVGRPDRRGFRRAPIFSISMWSVHERVLQGLLKTNNAVECWHSVFQNTLGYIDPSVDQMVGALRLEQDYQETTITKCGSGINADEIMGNDEKRTEALLTLTSKFHEMPRMEYMRGIANNLKLSL